MIFCLLGNATGACNAPEEEPYVQFFDPDEEDEEGERALHSTSRFSNIRVEGRGSKVVHEVRRAPRSL